MSLKKNTAEELLPVFGGFIFFLSTIELIIPKPVPFFRLGLANLPILLAINIFPFKTFFLLLLIKSVGQALVSGTLFSYIFLLSVISSLSSGIVMYSMKNLLGKSVSYVGISIAGAFVSNGMQLLIALFFIFGKSALYIVPLLFLTGLITAVFLGVFVNKFTEDSIWYKNIIEGTYNFSLKNFSNEKNEYTRSNYLRLASGLFLFLLLLFTPLLSIKAIIFGVGLLFCAVDRQRIKFTHLFFVFFSIIIFNLFPPFGKVLFTVFNFAVTNQAILRGIEKAVLLEGMVYLSKWMLRVKFNFHSKFGNVITESFAVFDRFLSMRKEVNVKKIIPTIDSILLSLNK